MRDAEQAANLERVSERIAGVVREFIRRHEGRCFRGAELEHHVEEAVGRVTPGSPLRILRDLRQKGIVQVVLEQRSTSTYSVPRRFHVEPSGQLSLVGG